MLKTVALTLVAACAATTPAMAENFIVYIGSYTDSPPTSTSKGIYAARFNSDDGTLTPMGLMAETPNPAYLTGSKDGKTLYAANWQSPNFVKNNGLDTVSSYRIDRKTGQLAPLNVATSQGALTNEVMLDRTGKVLVAVNYGGDVGVKHNAGVSALKVEADGKLSDPFYVDIHPNEPIATPPAPRPARAGAGAAPDPMINFGPHVHGIAFSTNNKFVFIADLGLDRIYTYRLNAAKPSLEPAPGKAPFIHVGPNSGPRRLVVSADGKFLYCNYQDNTKTGVFRIAADGSLTLVQEISTEPADFKGNSGTAEIAIDKAGKHLYVENRRNSNIAVYGIDKASGQLTALEFIPSEGTSPRNLTFDPTGKYLLVANQASGDVVVFKQDPDTGHLTYTGSKVQVSQAAGMFVVKAQ